VLLIPKVCVPEQVEKEDGELAKLSLSGKMEKAMVCTILKTFGFAGAVFLQKF